MREELTDRIDEALKSLSPPLRAAIVLTTLQGYGVAEAARIAGCKAGTMYWRIHKARKLLKGHLSAYMKS
jgi:RNA polymerase sigma factor (sigma-70 family)